MTPVRQSHVAIEYTDIIEAQEATLENVLPLVVFAVHPPGEVEQELLEDLFQEIAVALACEALLKPVDVVGGPGVNGRVDIAEGPLIRRNLAVRMHIPLA